MRWSRARACVDYGVHVKVSVCWYGIRMAGSLFAEGRMVRGTQSKLRILQSTYLWFMQAGHSRDCATGSSMSKHCDASS